MALRVLRCLAGLGLYGAVAVAAAVGAAAEVAFELDDEVDVGDQALDGAQAFAERDPLREAEFAAVEDCVFKFLDEAAAAGAFLVVEQAVEGEELVQLALIDIEFARRLDGEVLVNGFVHGRAYPRNHRFGKSEPS